MHVFTSHEGRARRAVESNCRLQHASPRTRARRLRVRNHAPEECAVECAGPQGAGKLKVVMPEFGESSCTVLEHDLLMG